MNTCPASILRPDSSEAVLYDFKDYPLYLQHGILSQYPNYSAISHWHEDLEFILILSGHMIYNVNGALYRLNRGEGIFVNSRQIHHGFSDDFSECEFLCILFSPSLLRLNDFFDSEYVTPILTNVSCPCLPLSQSEPWQKLILALLPELYQKKEVPLAPLEIQPVIWNLWRILSLNLPKPQEEEKHPARQLSAVRNMLAYIQQHYKDALTLDQIAAAGHVCKSSCLMLFRTYLSQSPIRYLTDYRLKKALELLRNTDLSITEISYRVGFRNPSYFAETFRKYYQCTPREYGSSISSKLSASDSSP